MTCYIVHSKFLKKGNLQFHQFFANRQLLFIHIADSKPWESLIFLVSPMRKLYPIN